MQPVMTGDEVMSLLDNVFPQIHEDGRVYEIASVASGEAVVRFTANQRHLRPGGTVSGPSMMALADLAAYVVILGHIGPQALAVTTNLNINFLNKPGPGAMLATCRILKMGKRLIVVDCAIESEGQDGLVAHATATYSVPPR